MADPVVNPYIPASAGQDLIGVHFPAARVQAVYEWAQSAVTDPEQRAAVYREELDTARKNLTKLQEVYRTRVNTAEGGLSDKDILDAQLKLRGQDLDVQKANADRRLRARELAEKSYTPPPSLGRLGPELADTLRKTTDVAALNTPEVLTAQLERALNDANVRSGGALSSATAGQKRAAGVEILSSLDALGLPPDVVLAAEAKLEGMLGVPTGALEKSGFEADKEDFTRRTVAAAGAGGGTIVDDALQKQLLNRSGEARYVGGEQAEKALTPDEEKLRDRYVAALSDTSTPGEVQTGEFASAEEFAAAQAAYDKARGAGAYSRAQRQFFDPTYLNSLKDVKRLEQKVAQAESGAVLSPLEREQEVARLFRERARFIPGVSIDGAAPDYSAEAFKPAGAVNPIFAELGPLVMQNLASTRGGMDLRTPADDRKDPVSMAQRKAAEIFRQNPNQAPAVVLDTMQQMNLDPTALKAGMVHYLSMRMAEKVKGQTMDFQGVPGTVPSAAPKAPFKSVMGAAVPGSDLAKRDAVLNPVLFREEAIAAQRAAGAEARDIADQKVAEAKARAQGVREQDRFERRDLRRSLETPEGVFVRKFRERARGDFTDGPPSAEMAGVEAPPRPLTDAEMEEAIRLEMERQRRLGL